MLWRWIAGLLVTVIITHADIPLAAAQTEPDRPLEEIHSEWSQDGELQLERPSAEPEAQAPPQRSRTPGWIDWLSDILSAFFSAIGPLFRILFYVLIGAIVLAIGWFILGQVFDLRLERFRRRKKEIEVSQAEDIRPDAAQARSLLEEADALAREGRFAQAVHLLLFRSIEDIQERGAGGLSRAMTAREIGALSALPDRARRALAPIIGVVERSFFGGREVDRAGWETARASYEEFAFGETWT